MIRAARPADVPAIKSLIDVYAQQELMLPRNLADVYSLVRDFTIAEDNGEILGCVALHIVDESLAEVRSLAVADGMKGKGLGRLLVEDVLKEARSLGLKQVFALTYVPGFFQKLGFLLLEDKSTLPHKVWTECINCPKFPECDEEALIIDL